MMINTHNLALRTTSPGIFLGCGARDEPFGARHLILSGFCRSILVCVLRYTAGISCAKQGETELTSNVLAEDYAHASDGNEAEDGPPTLVVLAGATRLR